MSSVTFEILIILLLVIANGVFAMSEIAVVSARKARLQELAEDGDAKAQAALELANAPNRFLSTVQVGITLIGILAGAFGGATLAGRLAPYIGLVPLLKNYSQAIAFGLVVAIITYLSIIIGELVPKRLALASPEKIAASVAIPMQWLSRIAYPVVYLLTSSTDSILRLLGAGGASDEPLVTEEEIKVLIRQGAEAGTFEIAEQDMVERVFRLGDQHVASLMTPRFDITWLDINDSTEVNRQKMIESRHSRFPVCQDNPDHVLGVVNVTDLLARSLLNRPLDLIDILRQPLFVPESTRAFKVLEMFKQSGTHIALVVDEYGVTQGIVTLNDVMEVIIGDVPFADQPHESPAIQREDGSWLLDGTLPIEKFKEIFEIEEIPGEDRGNFQTLGGFVITQLGRIPTSSDHFEWNNLRLEVMDMDGNRVDKVLVMPTQFQVQSRN
ncbi:HlyC/CorC family transporter [Oculatella sp. FACHB-28]|uniref:hemolysin family protein n=1 Tax=Cyanophyceae TaxID=3028117 RepID=UPI00168614CC|nr:MULTISPECIES: hemolysin family protein [Cyanophyceae]MBD1868272.1 HlyC/CorC family transporter [Cyanobacteria bacterium FACHB-471]MBD1997610.1 HlyC/CorC family transporter [Leptolyngbya sp. FACHB-541]MBD2055758.1 HlyC/CorC family transporter [Oculatella sp. FACHB-28]